MTEEAKQTPETTNTTNTTVSNPPREETVAKEEAARKAAEKAEKKEIVEQAIKEARKTEAEEMSEIAKYPALKLIIRFAKVLAITFAVIFVVIAIIALFTSDSWWGGIVNFVFLLCLGIAFFALTWCFGDFFQLLIDIEENTKHLKKRE